MFSSKLFALFIISCLKFIPECGTSDQQNQIPAIPLSELLDELQRQPTHTLFETHLRDMFSIASYGQRLYAVSKEISPECSQIAIAASIMLKNLTMGFRVTVILEHVMNRINHEDLKLSIDRQEHPLELVCRKVEKFFALSPTPLRRLFEMAKIKAADVEIISSPPYASALITSQEKLDSLEKDWYDHPEWAEEWVLQSFYAQRDAYTSDPEMLYLLFADSVVKVAEKEEFADLMQSLFMRAVKDVLPQITQSSREIREEDFFWLPNFLQIFYNHIAEDATLKKEVEYMFIILSHGEMTLDGINISKNIHSEL